MKLKTKTIFTYIFSLIWLMSLCIGFSFINKSQLIYDDLVYCPLQKTWVKRNEETQAARKNPFDQICMSDSKKQELAIQISLKNAFAITEKGIFETLQKGVKVLDSYRETQNLPNQTLVQIRHSFSVLNSANDLRQVFTAKSEAFSFALNSRPPTIQKVAEFYFQPTKTLDQISRNINPRSPPFSI